MIVNYFQIEFKLDLNLKNKDNISILHSLFLYNNTEILNLIFNYPNLTYINYNLKEKTRYTLFMIAYLYSDIIIEKILIQKFGIN